MKNENGTSESNLILLLGSSPAIRIIDALVDNIGSDYSKKEIQGLAGISKATLFNHWAGVEAVWIVKSTRTFGRTTLYTLNKENRIVKDLLRLEMDLIEKTAPQVARTKERG